jgi:hypothetical protein
MSESDAQHQMLDRPGAFAELARLGADRAVVEFSGGNDEGGPDSITLYQGENNVSALSPSAYAGLNASAAQKAEADLVACLSQPIYDQFGGFDGDFDVYGELIWDVAAQTVHMLRDERSEYEHIEEWL